MVSVAFDGEDRAEGSRDGDEVLLGTHDMLDRSVGLWAFVENVFDRCLGWEAVGECLCCSVAADAVLRLRSAHDSARAVSAREERLFCRAADRVVGWGRDGAGDDDRGAVVGWCHALSMDEESSITHDFLCEKVVWAVDDGRGWGERGLGDGGESGDCAAENLGSVEGGVADAPVVIVAEVLERGGIWIDSEEPGADTVGGLEVVGEHGGSDRA